MHAINNSFTMFFCSRFSNFIILSPFHIFITSSNTDYLLLVSNTQILPVFPMFVKQRKGKKTAASRFVRNVAACHLLFGFFV